MLGIFSALNRMMLNLVLIISFRIFAFENSVHRTPLIASASQKEILVKTVYDSTQVEFQSCAYNPAELKSAEQIKAFILKSNIRCKTISLSVDILSPQDNLNLDNELILRLKRALRLYSIGWTLEDISFFGASGLLAGSLAHHLSVIMTEKGTVHPLLAASARAPFFIYGAYKLITDNMEFIRAKRCLNLIEKGLREDQWPLVQSNVLYQIFGNVARHLIFEKRGILNLPRTNAGKSVE